MIYLKSMLNVIDNSGAQLAECIKVLRKSPKNHAQLGDKIVVVVQKARPLTSVITGATNANRVKKGILFMLWLSDRSKTLEDQMNHGTRSMTMHVF